jgi:FtsP/CotA-like multicopper oxidase with cupredoxin domain
MGFICLWKTREVRFPAFARESAAPVDHSDSMSKSRWVPVFVFFVAPWCAFSQTQAAQVQPAQDEPVQARPEQARPAQARPGEQSICPRPAIGSVVAEPEDLRSRNGVLEADLTARDVPDAHGNALYCYTDAAGRESPTLRVKPGDLVILHLKNALTEMDAAKSSAMATHVHHASSSGSIDHGPESCGNGEMSAVSTNLHFHGLTIPPVCHQDDVLKTLVHPGEPAFEYRFRIPDDEPPGLYWYHPHIHGFSKQQLLGGASGVLVVEGIERAKKVLAGLPERVFVIRDQDLVNPNAPPAKSEPVVPKFLVDRDGDAANTGTGFGKPAKDLSINYVPVPYPDYAPAVIEMRPKERQLWRVLNASAITYLNLEVLFSHTPQSLGVVAMDGVPLSHDDPAGEMVSLLWMGPRMARAGFLLRARWIQDPEARTIRIACWQRLLVRRMRPSRDRS